MGLHYSSKITSDGLEMLSQRSIHVDERNTFDIDNE
jgi:hypothetical protein